MQADLKEVISNLNEELNEIKEQISLIESIDWDNLVPVTESEFKKLCLTSLRGTSYLEDILKATFPEATQIKQTCNYIIFQLYGFTCKLPTSRIKGIEIDMEWSKCGSPPVNRLENNNMYLYFKREDEKAGWEELFNLRLSDLKHHPKAIKWLLWYGKYKWKDTKRKEWEKQFQKMEQGYLKSVEDYNETVLEIKRKMEDFHTYLIPELSKFTEDIKPTKEIEMVQILYTINANATKMKL